MHILIVGGTFGDVPKKSGFIRKLSECDCFLEEDVLVQNGGKYEDLEDIIRNQLGNYKVILWMPNVDNSKPKLVQEIKKRCTTLLLVTSKRNVGGKYSPHALIARQLQSKANMLIEFTKVLH